MKKLVKCLLTLLVAASMIAATPGPHPIKDKQTTTSTIKLTANNKVYNLKVTLDIDHTYVGDLVVTLSHDGKTVVLINRIGCGAGNIKATFRDDATKAAEKMCDPDPAISGGVLPLESLSKFNGQLLSGDWTLTIYDDARGDEGSLVDWSITNK